MHSHFESMKPEDEDHKMQDHDTSQWRQVNKVSVLNGHQRFAHQGLTSSGKASREASVLAQNTGQLDLGSSDSRTESSSDDELTSGNTPPLNSPLHASTLKTGLCYDARMRFHCELAPPKDRSNYHPEDPRRIYHIYRELCESGLVNDPSSPQSAITLQRIPARYATKPEICLVHDRAHFDFIASTRG